MRAAEAREAALIWLVATVVEGGLGDLLVVIGVVRWGVVDRSVTPSRVRRA